MLKSRLVLLFVLLNVFLLTSAMAEDAVTDQNKVIVVNKQQPNFTIRLKANPTTGYSWILKSMDNDYIDAVFQKYIPPNTKMIGAGGVSEFGFVAKPDAFKVSRQFKISFMYTRPWEVADGSVVTFTVVTQAE